ncbi:MAG: hypothetical protein K2H00_00785, partial [Muribaculum intestinale]|nr:hypothetical protein [Muribaculum intestinale]
PTCPIRNFTDRRATRIDNNPPAIPAPPYDTHFNTCRHTTTSLKNINTRDPPTRNPPKFHNFAA